MKALAERFPGAVLVFATLRQPTEMSETELAAMRELALWGREYTLGEYRSRSPVILLTAIELFAGYSLTDAWNETGGRHAEFAKAAWLRADNLRVLADITQQLYLALPSYSEWHRVKWEAIHAERAAADAIAQASTEANSHQATRRSGARE